MIRSVIAVLFGGAMVLGCGSADERESVELMNEGISAFNAGKATEAQELLERAAARHSENHQANYSLGQVYESKKKWDKAADAYAAATKVNDGDAMYHYRLGKAYYMTKKASQAQTHLEDAVNKNDRLYKAHYFLGKVYYEQDKPKQAAEAWTKAAQLNPFFGLSFNALGKLYTDWDMLAQAVSVLEQGTTHVRDPKELSDIYYHLGLAYERQGNYDSAIEAYTKSLDKEKGNLDALRQRGFVYDQKGDKKNAQVDLKAFVESGGAGNAFHIQAANERLVRIVAGQ